MIGSDQLAFSRCSGTQNTFLIANVLDNPWKDIYSGLAIDQKKRIAKNLCASFHGFKTDGLLFLYAFDKYDFAWDFFNSDGSFAEMCGNAARCASLYFYKKIDAKNNIHFFTGAGDIKAEILKDNIVKVEMPKISIVKSMNVLGQDGIFLDTGVPHFVLERSPNEELAKKLRQVSDFGKSGSNITFVENVSEGSIKAITFERGVEDYTRACGTGAVAAAMYYQQKKNIKTDVRVKMPGGDLQVQSAESGKRPFLVGPAQLEFDLLIDKKIIMEK